MPLAILLMLACVCSHAHVSSCAPSHIETQKRTHTHTHAYAYTVASTHKRRTHTNISRHTSTHTYTHTMLITYRQKNEGGWGHGGLREARTLLSRYQKAPTALMSIVSPPGMEKLHSKRHELLVCWIVSIVIVLNILTIQQTRLYLHCCVR